MTIQRWRRKPEPSTPDTVFAARFTPGEPLGELARVARMASSDSEVAECTLSSGVVLLVRWRRYRDEGPSEIDYEVVHAGDYLTYSQHYGSLNAETDAELRRWYEPAGV